MLAERDLDGGAGVRYVSVDPRLLEPDDAAVADTSDRPSSTPGQFVSYDGLAPARSLPEQECQHEEGFFQASPELIAPGIYEDLDRPKKARKTDDTRLFWQRWGPQTTDRGLIALMHGYGEHSSRFAHVGAALARGGYTTVALDARGHGRSSGRRGHVTRYADYVLDYAEFVERIRRRFGRTPLYAFGHSNGGLIVLRYALATADHSHVSAWAVTSPFCGFPGDIPAIKRVAGKILSRIWGTLGLQTDIDPSDLSHIDRVAEMYADDPLVFEEATAKWFTETLATQSELFERANEISNPFLFLLAGDDKIVDAEAAHDLFHALGSSDRELEIFSDLYHEILNETSWTDVMDCLISWFRRHERMPSETPPQSTDRSAGDAE